MDAIKARIDIIEENKTTIVSKKAQKMKREKEGQKVYLRKL